MGIAAQYQQTHGIADSYLFDPGNLDFLATNEAFAEAMEIYKVRENHKIEENWA